MNDLTTAIFRARTQQLADGRDPANLHVRLNGEDIAEFAESLGGTTPGTVWGMEIREDPTLRKGEFRLEP